MMADRETLDVYAQRTAEYAARSGSPKEKKQLDRFLDALPQGARVLDLGCGPGDSSARMAERGFDVAVYETRDALGGKARSMPVPGSGTDGRVDLPGEHGFHVHENGDCSAPDASSAGGHFNPADHEHAGPDAERQHMGDMGNITAGEDGTARVDAEYRFLVLDPEADNSIMGKAVVVHAGADDMSSQPSGDAGARVACGVITNAPQ